ncbi:DNA starvation/stationary phase protection protein [Flavobacteriaceae bacterium TP-CH-4]|uniref:DNA starvation/stationary phase protection protein n=1 Tax=Pelagihabitans pacificus TaxID=2696054 RepID=A0A967E875_9FLAO|nr:Dps family protein [Pelagihabitans pacificus]NHF61009.1 DNA starvation/stationary phase protection protein [Pelagihabitans pacificus]
MNYLNINEKKIEPIVSELNLLLADYHVYYQKLRAFHWNILGQNFFDLHNKFEELYNDAKTKIDELAERILTLRYHPISTFGEYLQVSSIKETSPLISDVQMVDEILKDHGEILKQMSRVMKVAEEAGDEGTLDMIGAYMGELEKISWMLDAFRQDTRDQLKVSDREKVS